MVLSLTTHRGVQDFAFNKEQALLIAKTIKETAAKLEKPKRVKPSIATPHCHRPPCAQLRTGAGDSVFQRRR